MYRPTALILCLMLSMLSRRALAEGPRVDALTDNFFPPELLVRHAQDIGLDEKQRQSIESRAREMHQQFADLQQNLQREMTALAEILKRDHPDEAESLAQLDKVLAAEREIKRTQLRLSLKIRNELTPDQQTKAREIRHKLYPESRQPMEKLRAKMQQLQQRIQRMQSEGRDPGDALRAEQQCKQLMMDGKPAEAEALLDRVLSSGRVEEKQ